MKHIGDITKIDGTKIPPVDVITGGSPCQDVSVAGARAGLSGSKSGLFFEMIRVIREMLVSTNGQYPKFIIFENVPGMFTSNKGEDFRIVLEEFANLAGQEHAIPRPEWGGWQKSGAIAGDGWSIAWRTFNSKYWGVPQNRSRVALVMDLRGQRAADILFEQESVSGDSESGIPAWKGIARAPEDSTGRHDRKLTTAYSMQGYGDYKENDASSTLKASHDSDLQNLAVVESHSQDARYRLLGDVSCTVTAQWGTGGNNMPFVIACAAGADVTKHYIVRRMTPTETERLQGYEDGWTDISEWYDEKGKKHRPANSPRYKALGNSIALPQWWWLVNKMAAYLPERPTLGSLFDGIGGFPCVFEEKFGKGSAIWASEVEPFCIAVTKERFPEDES